MTVRPLTEADLPHVLAIERDSYPDPWTEGVFRSCLTDERTYCFAVCDGEALCGYCCLYHAYDGCEISVITVAAEYRQRGAATLMLLAMERKTLELGCTFMTLEARIGNAPAIALYERFGFIREGIRPGYYLHPPEDAVIMTKYYNINREDINQWKNSN